MTVSVANAEDVTTTWRQCLPQRFGAPGEEASIAACTKIIDSADQSPANRALALRGRARIYTEQTLDDDAEDARALADFDRAIELQPQSADAYLDRAEFHHDHFVEDRALADLDRAVALDPGKGRAFHLRGLVRGGRGDKEGAAEDLTRAIGLGVTLAYGDRARLYEYQFMDWGRAIADYNAAVDEEPAKSAMYRSRAGAFRRHHDFANAVADLDTALLLEPNLRAALIDRCFTRAAWGQQLDQASEDCSAAAQARATAPGLQEAIGYLQLRRGAWQEALAAFDVAIGRRQYAPRAFYGRGLARRHLGQTEAGEADIAAAVQAAPGQVEELRGYGF